MDGGESGAVLEAVLADISGTEDPLSLLRPGDVILTLWLPGAPHPVLASTLAFGAILRAAMEGGCSEQPLVVTLGPAPLSLQGDGRTGGALFEPSPSKSSSTASADESVQSSSEPPPVIQDVHKKLAEGHKTLSSWMSGGLANLSAISEQIDAKVAHAVKEQGWLTPSAMGEQIAVEKQAKAKRAAQRKANASSQAAERGAETGSATPQPSRRKSPVARATTNDPADARMAQRAHAKEAAAKLEARAARSKQVAADGGVLRAQVQAWVLARWATAFLNDPDTVVSRPAEDLRSGVIVYRLCEKLRGAPLTDYGRLVLPPQGQAFTKSISSLSNFYAAFRFLKERFGWPEDDEEYCSSEAIGRVGDGNLTAAVDLLWLLAVHFTADQLGVLYTDHQSPDISDTAAFGSSTPEPFTYASVAAALEARKLATRKVLVKWVCQSTRSFPDLKVRGLGRSSMGDGLVLLALVSAHAPQQCPYAPFAIEDNKDNEHESLVGAGTVENVAAALGAAHSLFGCAPLWDVEEDTPTVLMECASEALFLTVASFKQQFPGKTHPSRGVKAGSESDSSRTSQSSAGTMADGTSSDDDNDDDDDDNDDKSGDDTARHSSSSTNGAAELQGHGAGCGKSGIVLVTVHRAEGLPIHTTVGKSGRRAALAAAVRVGQSPKRRLGGSDGNYERISSSGGGGGNALGKWHATEAVRLNPCPAWAFTATVPLAFAYDLSFEETSTTEESSTGGSTIKEEGEVSSVVSSLGAKKFCLEVFVKVLAVDEDSGDDLCLGSLALKLPLTGSTSTEMDSSSVGSSGDNSNISGGEKSKRRLWPPVQAPVDRRFFTLTDPRSSRASASADCDEDNHRNNNEDEGVESSTGMRVLLSVSALEPGSVAAWQRGAGAGAAAEEAALRKRAAKSKSLEAENARLKKLLASMQVEVSDHESNGSDDGSENPEEGSGDDVARSARVAESDYQAVKEDTVKGEEDGSGDLAFGSTGNDDVGQTASGLDGAVQYAGRDNEDEANAPTSTVARGASAEGGGGAGSEEQIAPATPTRAQREAEEALKAMADLLGTKGADKEEEVSIEL